MAGSVFFFTAGESPNWEKTIGRPIDVEAVARMLPRMTAESLRAKAGAGPVHAWGAPATAVGTVAGMSEDDVVFGSRKGNVGFGGLVALSIKEPTPELSTFLWGAPSWPFVYLLYRGVSGQRPVPEFLADMGESGKVIQGFRVSHRASQLLRSVDSADDFMRIALGLAPIARSEPVHLVEIKEGPAPDALNGVGEIGHSEAQADLMRIGEALGLDVWVAANDRSKTVRDYSFRDHSLRTLPFKGQPEFQRQIELIDVLWLRGSSIRAAFEVEHSTQVYSGLLRLLDLAVQFPNISFPLFVVAPDADRRRVCAQLNRPSFREHRLNEMCKYIPYSRLRDAVLEVSRFGRKLDPTVIDDYALQCNASELVSPE